LVLEKAVRTKSTVEVVETTTVLGESTRKGNQDVAELPHKGKEKATDSKTRSPLKSSVRSKPTLSTASASTTAQTGTTKSLVMKKVDLSRSGGIGPAVVAKGVKAWR